MIPVPEALTVAVRCKADCKLRVVIKPVAGPGPYRAQDLGAAAILRLFRKGPYPRHRDSQCEGLSQTLTTVGHFPNSCQLNDHQLKLVG